MDRKIVKKKYCYSYIVLKKFKLVKKLVYCYDLWNLKIG